MSKTEKALNKVLLFLVIAAVATLSLRKLSNFDFWQHLSSGRYMVENGKILTRDVFSYTIRGKPWVNHQWLSQVLIYLGYGALGAEWIVVCKAFLFVLTFGIILSIGLRKETAFLSAGVVLLSALAASGRLMLRPEAFTLFLTSVYLALLFRHEKPGSGRRYALYFLPLIQLVWANLHGGSLIGIGLLWIFIVGDFMDTRLLGRVPGGYDERRRERDLLAIGLLAMGACFCTPSGWRLLLQPFQAFASPSFMSDIGEWTPPFTGPPETRGFAQIFYAVFLCISAGTSLLNLKRIRCSSMLLLAVFAYLSLKAQRNMALFALVAAPVTVANLNDMLLPILGRGGGAARLARSLASGVLIAASLFLLFAVSTNRYYVWDNSASVFGAGINWRSYPRDGADFILENNIPGRVFNNYDIGSYLMWRFHPRRSVFVDGRNDLYGDEFMYSTYRKALSEPPFWEGMAAYHGIHSAVIRHNAFEVKDLLRHLHASKQWVPCHLDDICVIFLRDSPSLGGAAEKLGLDLESHIVETGRSAQGAQGRIGTALDRYPPKVSFPFEKLHTASFFASIGMNDRAAEEYRKAAALRRASAEIRNSLGIALNESGRHAEAEESFREALALEPYHAAARNNLGFALIKQGRLTEAEEELKLLIAQHPGYVLAHNSLGICYDTQGRRLEAREEWRKALDLDPFFRPARVLLEGARQSGAASGPAKEDKTKQENI